MARLECYGYWPAKPFVGVADVKEKLPNSIRQALMTGSRTADFGIFVDAHKIDVVRELDNRFGIAKRHDFTKDHIVEITKDQILHFTSFLIRPRILEHNKAVFFELSPP